MIALATGGMVAAFSLAEDRASIFPVARDRNYWLPDDRCVSSDEGSIATAQPSTWTECNRGSVDHGMPGRIA